MTPPGSADFKELVRSRTDIVGLIGEGISLQSQRMGQEYSGLCPFHDDTKPSLRVYPERQTFKCWSCNTGGDCFEYVMQSERVGFREALELLANRANLELPRSFGRRDDQQGMGKSQLFEAVAWAEQQFHDCLLNSPQAAAAREYLQSRGFTEKSVREFRLGYHPNEWEWLIGQARGKFGLDVLAAAKLISERKDGRGYYDYFVDRVMFPIRDMQRRAVAFGGRILPGHSREDAPKYFNSLESVIFTKSRLLFGLEHARDAIRRSDTVVVVEGYTDCITAQQYGQQNVVGTLGTALTETHVTNLKRFARRVVLVYDGDDAGQNAAERALNKFLAQEVDLRILTLPAGLDPADFLESHGLEAFAKKIENAPEAWQHKLRRTIERYGLESIDAKDRVLDEMLEVLSVVTHSGGGDAGKWRNREDLILGSLVQRLGVKEPAVRSRLAEIRRRNQQRQSRQESPTLRYDEPVAETVPVTKPTTVNRRDMLLEREVLQILMADPSTIEEIHRELALEEIQDGQLRALLSCCFDVFEAGEEVTFHRMMAELEDSALKGLAVSLDEEARRMGIGAELLKQTLACLRERHEDDPHKVAGELQEHVQQSGDNLNHETAAMLRRQQESIRKRAVKNKLA